MKISPAVAVFAAAALSAMVPLCALAQAAAPTQAESLLVAAGFKTVVASTDKQLQQIPTLPAGQVSVVSQTGRNYFVYPDLAHNRIYVGTEKEYQAYMNLRAQNNMPTANPQGSYMQQDAAMRKADARGASVPWELWPDFKGLGW
jgi:hypothetical protein